MGPLLQQVDRTYVLHRGRKLIYFGGCDYFRLASHPVVLATVGNAACRYGLNVAASRATTGNHPLYAQLERALARFAQVEKALLVPNGYATNLIVAQALAGEATHALVDERAHASSIDAAQVLGCPRRVFRHRDAADLSRTLRRLPRGARPVVLTDGLFARDGTVAPLADYVVSLPPAGWLVVDDAHGLGVLGRNGRGTPEVCGVRSPRLIQTGTLSKAFGAYGGVILGARAPIERIAAGSRQFGGSTPLPLPLAAAALAALRTLRSDRLLRARLSANTRYVKEALRTLGLTQADTPCPVASVQATSARSSARLRQRLLCNGVYPNLIRYPGGPVDGYFRFALSSEHTREQLDRLLASLRGIDGLQPLIHSTSENRDDTNEPPTPGDRDS